MSRTANLALGAFATLTLVLSQAMPLQAEPQPGQGARHAGSTPRSGGGEVHRPGRTSSQVQIPRPSGGGVVQNRRRGGGERFEGGHRGRRYIWGDGLEFYFYDGYYHGNCGWLKEQALETGSAYWWRRYRICRAY